LVFQNWIQKGKKMKKPKIVTIDQIEVLCKRVEGDKINSANTAWRDMVKFIEEGDLLKDAVFRYGISKQNYYDACVEFIDTPKTSADIMKKTIEGGKYACFLYQGDYKDLENAFEEIRNWVTENEVTLRNADHFQKYLDFDITGVQPETLRTEIYIPLV
jgi:AraC family transcriptional regulator